MKHVIILALLLSAGSSMASEARDRTLIYDDHKRSQGQMSRFVSSLVLEELKDLYYTKDIIIVVKKYTEIEYSAENARFRTEIDVFRQIIVKKAILEHNETLWLSINNNKKEVRFGLHYPYK